MKTPDTIEDEIDRIRLKIYEETKHMTPAQRVERTRRNAEATALKCGFKIVESADGKRTLRRIRPDRNQ